MIITSCVSINSHALTCKKNSVIKKGFNDGELGVNHIEYVKEFCSKYETQVVSSLYNQGRNKGLKTFCSSKRGENRAVLNLELEEDCKNYEDYVVWFEKGIDQHCTKERALNDSKNFEPSNTNCLKNKVYNKTFMNALKKSCTKKWAFQQGLNEKELEPFCLKMNNRDSLVMNHRVGLERKVFQKNTKLQLKATELKSKLRLLKSIVPHTSAGEISNKAQQDSLSKQLLDTLHAIEQNSSKL